MCYTKVEEPSLTQCSFRIAGKNVREYTIPTTSYDCASWNTLLVIKPNTEKETSHRVMLITGILAENTSHWF